jgi:hypothetical protein
MKYIDYVFTIIVALIVVYGICWGLATVIDSFAMAI